MSSPLRHHLGAAKRMPKYVSRTLDHGIWYEATEALSLIGYSDSEWAGSLEDQRSTTGNVFMLGTGPISWCSKKQSVTALSTTEAEYLAATSATYQVVWLRRLLDDIGVIQSNPTPIFCDNISTIAIAKNPNHNGRTKHIVIKFHYIRELIVGGEITLQRCITVE